MPPLDLNEIRKLVRLMEKAELTEIEIDDQKEGLRVHLKKAAGGEDGAQLVQLVAPPVGAAPPPVGYPQATGAPAPAAAPEGGGGASGDLPPGTELLRSPMVGTFYRSSSPDAEPFVEAGSRVEEESVLCIVEAMKVMNEIKAEIRGEILEVLVENGEPVEYGQPLFLLKKG